jgi:periplasmic divalent cation tolerance protein
LSDYEMRDAPEEFILVFTTLGTTEAAREFVRRLVDEHLVACGTIFPRAESVYRWDNKVTTADEVVVLLKTTRRRWDALATRVRAVHPYEVPELVAVPVTAGLESYLAWVAAETIAEGGR